MQVMSFNSYPKVNSTITYSSATKEKDVRTDSFNYQNTSFSGNDGKKISTEKKDKITGIVIGTLISGIIGWILIDWAYQRKYKGEAPKIDLPKIDPPKINEISPTEKIIKELKEKTEEKIKVFSKQAENPQEWSKLSEKEQILWKEVEKHVQNLNQFIQPNQENNLRLLGRLALEEKQIKQHLDIAPAIMLHEGKGQNTKQALKQMQNLTGARLLTVEHKGNINDTYNSIVKIIREDSPKHFTEKNERTLLHIDNFEQFLKDSEKDSKDFEGILNFRYPYTTFVYKAASEKNIPKNILDIALTKFKIAIK